MNDGTSVRFYFSDADPVAECECGWHAHGDAAVDAFRDWWRHVADAHPEGVVFPVSDQQDDERRHEIRALLWWIMFQLAVADGLLLGLVSR